MNLRQYLILGVTDLRLSDSVRISAFTRVFRRAPAKCGDDRANGNTAPGFRYRSFGLRACRTHHEPVKSGISEGLPRSCRSAATWLLPARYFARETIMTNAKDDEANTLTVDRRGALECMLWAGTGVLWTISGGVPSSALLGSAQAQGAGLSFLQISDSHIGFDRPANP